MAISTRRRWRRDTDVGHQHHAARGRDAGASIIFLIAVPVAIQTIEKLEIPVFESTNRRTRSKTSS